MMASTKNNNKDLEDGEELDYDNYVNPRKGENNSATLYERSLEIIIRSEDVCRQANALEPYFTHEYRPFANVFFFFGHS